MATSGHGRNTVFKLDNAGGSLTDISAYCRSVNLQLSSEAADVTAMGNKGMERVSGIDDVAIDAEGLWDATIAAILDGALSFQKSYEVHPHGTGTGAVKYTGEAIGSSVEIEINFDSEITWSLSLEGDGAYTRGSN